MKDAAEIAQQVLDAHAIRDDWRRTGAQVRKLIIEGIEQYLDQNGVEIQQWTAEHDGVHVVQIDTPQHSGRIRVNLNDAPIWDGDPSTDERPGANFHDVWDDEDADDDDVIERTHYDLLDPNEREI